jgi:hypothetical protein
MAFKPERRGGVVEAQHVRGTVHHDRAARRVSREESREQPAEQRPDRGGDPLGHAALLGDLHEPEPQAHHAGQADRDLEPGLRGIEQRGHHGLHRVGLPPTAACHTATANAIRKNAAQIQLSIGGGEYGDRAGWQSEPGVRASELGDA